MGSDIAKSVDHIGDVVSHLVRYRNREIIRKVFGEDQRIVTDLAPVRSNPVHAGRTPFQVEQNRNTVKLPIENRFRAADKCRRSANDKGSLFVVQRLN